MGSYADWDEEKRIEFLTRELEGKRPLIPSAMPMTNDVREVHCHTFDVDMSTVSHSHRHDCSISPSTFSSLDSSLLSPCHSVYIVCIFLYKIFCSVQPEGASADALAGLSDIAWGEVFVPAKVNAVGMHSMSQKKNNFTCSCWSTSGAQH